MNKKYSRTINITNHNKEFNISQLESKLSLLIKNHSSNGNHLYLNNYTHIINKYGIWSNMEEKPNKVELSKILQKGINELREKKCSNCSNIADDIVKEYDMYLSGRIS